MTKKFFNTDKNILIVEDQTSDLIAPYLLSNHLGYNVCIAFDGKQALEKALQSSYELILLDWNMPVMDGGDFLFNLNLLKDLTKKPCDIIIHTGSDLTEEDLPSSLAYRILDVWQKPLDAVDILRRIKNIKEWRAA